MASTKHHFVPEMHLRQFTANNRGEILVFDKRWQAKPSLKQPSGQGYKKHLYSIKTKDGAYTSAIEDDHFSKIDNAASLCLNGNDSKLKQSRTTLSNYIASLIIRNPRQIDSMHTNSEPLMTEVLNRMQSNPEFRQRVRARVSSDEEFNSMMETIAPGKATAKLTNEAVMILNFGAMFSIAKHIEDCDWTLLLAPRGSQFILSDVPVFTCDPNSKKISIAGLGNPGNETILPLTPNKCLLIRPGKHIGFRVRGASQATVREINRRSAYTSVERFFASQQCSELMMLVKEFPPRPAEQTAFKHEEYVIMPNLVDNHLFSPIWPE